MKTRLYVSDLDMTLLQPDARLTSFAIRNINNLITKGVLFTIASARSVKSIQPHFKDIELKLPIIEFNGSSVTAFGDNNNDIKMLQNADCGIAVENALKELLPYADIVIGPNIDDSVVQYIAEDNSIGLI